ncbi:hypothetical protein Mapa_017783 [Marchantia paleacea]|nr:hypothetical protein Mapa_017783 [Marchantia paleacea]
MPQARRPLGKRFPSVSPLSALFLLAPPTPIPRAPRARSREDVASKRHTVLGRRHVRVSRSAPELPAQDRGTLER